MFKNVKSLSPSLDEIVKSERRVRFFSVTVVYVIKVVKDVVQVKDITCYLHLASSYLVSVHNVILWRMFYLY